MSKAPNYTLIGAFVLAGIALAVTGVIAFGGGKFFTKSQKYVLYFEGSVKGLAVGAAVSFRGAKIGTVTGINIEINEADLSVHIPVTIEIEEGTATWISVNKDTPRLTPSVLIETLVKRGLRAQLSLESFVTGRLYIQFDFHPDKPENYVGTHTGYPELPTIPSSLEQLTAKLEEIPLADLLGSLRKTMDAIEKTMSSGDLDRSIRSLGDFLESADSVAKKLERELDHTGSDVRAALDDVREVMRMMQQTFGATSPLGYELLETLRSIGQASKSVEGLARSIDRQPDILLKGKP